jgi:hypothetical protein
VLQKRAGTGFGGFGFAGFLAIYRVMLCTKFGTFVNTRAQLTPSPTRPRLADASARTPRRASIQECNRTRNTGPEVIVGLERVDPHALAVALGPTIKKSKTVGLCAEL